jgi:hypothetical protein
VPDAIAHDLLPQTSAAALPTPSVPAYVAPRLQRLVASWALLMTPLACAVGAPSSVIQSRHTMLLGLLATWMAAGLAAVLGRRLASFSTLARLAQGDTFAVGSYVMPALAVALVGPLSLQGIVVGFLAVAGAAADTDSWFGLAIVGTVHVHVAFAVAMVVAAKRVAVGEDVTKVAVWPAVLLSLLPGALLFFPPALVWVCGVIVSQLFLMCANTWRAREGDALSHP